MDEREDHDPSAAVGVLDNVSLEAYYGPRCDTDNEIMAIVESVAARPLNKRRLFTAALDERRRRVLGRFSLRASMLALRASDPSYLHAGLIAHLLLHERIRDWRDDVVALAPKHLVAQQLHLDPAAVFDRAAWGFEPEWIRLYSTFGRRTDVTLQAFGWRQVETQDGPTFEMLHLKGSPSGAVVGEPSWDTVNRAIADGLITWAKSSQQESRE